MLRTERPFEWSTVVDSAYGPTQGSIRVLLRHGRAELSYRKDGTHYRCMIDFTSTPCHFGGERSWFQCPTSGCFRRAAKLYLGARGFACRTCYDLAYQSQCYGQDDRYVAQAAKIRRALGGPEGILDDFPDRPKGMHWRTYERFYRRCEAYERPVFATMKRLLALLDEVEASGRLPPRRRPSPP